MRLSKIKLSGFKSFVDATTIRFPSNLTGIVGPNGCGKSNVIDAIRWVLGESSAKTLRGDSMADVIFNGSSRRKPVGQASIELVFDNSDGKITGAYAGYSEIAVRRVVTRDGTSQYFLNNGRCRRKDITNILLGTGVGSHGYSIIEQGMISRLVEAKPEEMRAFLEEAAGISKYKERRRETEHRIRHTRDNLERLTDIRDELDKQLAHLRRQANAAERYKTLKAEERRTNAELLLLRLTELRGRLVEQEDDLKNRQLALEAAVTAEKEFDARIEKLRVLLSERHDTFNEAQGVFYKVGADIARLEQGIQHRRGTISRQETDLGEVESQITEINGHMDDDRGQLEQLELALGQLNPELEEASSALSSVERELADLETSVDQHRARSDELARDIANAERMAQVDAAKIEQLSQRQDRATREREERVAQRDSIRIGDFEQKIEDLVRTEEQQRGALEDAVRAIDTSTQELRNLRAMQSEKSDNLDKFRARLQQDRGRLSSLEALQAASLRTLSSDAEDWLEKAALADRPRLAERLDVEPGWERAIETVLTHYFHAVDVDDLGPLADSVGELARSGLALLEKGAAAPVDSAAVAGADALSSKLKAPESARGLLAGFLVAENLQAALDQRSDLQHGQSFVTRDGVVVSRNGVLTTSSDDPQLGVIARGEEIDQLRSSVETHEAKVATEGQALADLKDRIEALDGETGEHQRAHAQLQAGYTETKSELESTRARMDEARQRFRALEEAVAAFDAEIAEATAIVSQGTMAVDVARNHKAELEVALADHESEGKRLHQSFADVRNRTETGRERVKEIAILVEARRSTKESAAAALTRVQNQLEHLSRRRSELNELIEETRAPLAEEEQLLAQLLEERSGAEANLSRAREAVESCEGDVREAEAERGEKQQAVANAREATDQVRLEAREIQVRADTVSEQFDATGMAYDDIRSELAEDAEIEAWTEALESLGRKIQRLGSINLAAIDEFEEQSERKSYLDKQHEDLSSALETLEAAIRKIDRETRERFRETFEQANEGLGRLFPRLFGGGQAYLELDDDDLLTAGVTVMARPPGKRISTIHLMSGGEKALTAVALVFSIFELNPAPFCLLDEVDAPLDDANVGRFSEIVKEMSQSVQFVLITHNKTTMEAMNQLAGVTMHEPGVSRLVAVDIDEAVKLAAM